MDGTRSREGSDKLSDGSRELLDPLGCDLVYFSCKESLDESFACTGSPAESYIYGGGDGRLKQHTIKQFNLLLFTLVFISLPCSSSFSFFVHSSFGGQRSTRP